MDTWSAALLENVVDSGLLVYGALLCVCGDMAFELDCCLSLLEEVNGPSMQSLCVVQKNFRHGDALFFWGRWGFSFAVWVCY